MVLKTFDEVLERVKNLSRKKSGVVVAADEPTIIAALEAEKKWVRSSLLYRK